MEDEKIIINKDGQKVECDILFTFDCNDNNKSYVAYSDNTITAGRKTIYVSSFDPILGYGSLEDITNDQELEMIRDVLERIDKHAAN